MTSLEARQGKISGNSYNLLSPVLNKQADMTGRAAYSTSAVDIQTRPLPLSAPADRLVLALRVLRLRLLKAGSTVDTHNGVNRTLTLFCLRVPP